MVNEDEQIYTVIETNFTFIKYIILFVDLECSIQMNKISIILKSTFFSILFVIACPTLFAQTSGVKVIPRPSNPIMAVNDFANVLSPTQIEQLERKIRGFYDQTSNEIIVVTLKSLDGFSDDDVTYAYFNTWKIGNKTKDNGILVLLSLDPRKIRIEVGKGLEGALPDGMAGTIIRHEIIPLLKQSKYFEAFDNGTNAIIKATKGEYVMDDPNDRRDSGKSGGFGFIGIIIMFVIIIVILAIINKRGGGNGGMLSRRGYRRWGGPTVFDYGPWGGGIFGGGNSGGGSSSGGGFGDFGGFGGGSSGGGGASGDW